MSIAPKRPKGKAIEGEEQNVYVFKAKGRKKGQTFHK